MQESPEKTNDCCSEKACNSIQRNYRPAAAVVLVCSSRNRLWVCMMARSARCLRVKGKAARLCSKYTCDERGSSSPSSMDPIITSSDSSSSNRGSMDKGSDSCKDSDTVTDKGSDKGSVKACNWMILSWTIVTSGLAPSWKRQRRWTPRPLNDGPTNGLQPPVGRPLEEWTPLMDTRQDQG